MGCGRGLLKTWLVIFNILFFLVGFALIACSALILIDKSVILNVFSYAPDSIPVTTEELDNVLSQASYLKQAAYGIIGLGVFILLVGFCGCCGACKESKCLLGIYGVVVLLIFVAQLAGGILAYMYKEQAKAHLKDFALATMASYKGTTLADDGKLVYPTDVISQAWDVSQVTFKCCGMDAATDWGTQNVTFKYNVSSVEVEAKIPVTCCMMTGMENFPENLDSITITNADNCLAMTSDYNTDGCYQTIYDLAMEFGTIILGVCVGLLAFELFNAVFAFMLMRSVSKDGENA